MEVPPYIDLCIKLMQRKLGSDFALYERESFIREFPEVREDIWKLQHANGRVDHTHAMRSDYIRAQILYHKGGFWIDADAIVVNNFLPDLVSMFEVEKYDYIARRNEVGWFSMNFMGTRKGGMIIDHFIYKQDDMLDEVMNEPPYTIDAGSKFGSRLLTSVIKDLVPGYCYTVPEELVCPINFKGHENLFNTHLMPEDFNLEKIYCFQMFNRAFPDSVRQMSQDEFLSKPWFVSKLMRKLLEG